ncbi:hypothetical protein ACFQ1M_04400 [Sungkyunkwania multivorans]|uniref:Uncharacterized protein n=1 Tax=Sungkyunkwania multivorans TaxID=1173618 RepID=A0ABW3CWA9_9FLAO
MLKKLFKILFLIIVVIAIGVGYLYLRLHNDIDNVLVTNDEWRSEVLEFPLIFANDLDYQGEEHIRFAPGWGEKNREDYFSYIILWVLEENPGLSSSKLENISNTYFDGLMNTGAITNFNFLKKIPKTKSSIQQKDNNVFEGSIELYDEFFKKEVIVLNVKIKNEYCPLMEKYLVWFYLSPQGKDHQIWKQMLEIDISTKCR